MAWVEQQHADAVIDLLRGAPSGTIPHFPLTVYADNDEIPDDPPSSYVRVYIGTTRPRPGTSLTGASDLVVSRAYCHCVGRNDIEARAVAGRVAAALLDVVPTIPGRVCKPIRDDNLGQPPQRDESRPGMPVIDQLVAYRLESVPA